MTRKYSGREVAIIGISCRFPQSPDWQAFWQNLLDGKELISFFSEQQLLAQGVPESLLRQSSYVGAKASLEDHDSFDAAFFGYSSREAKKMDPQLRVLHEVTYNAFRDAGVALGDEPVNAGVFLGTTLSPARLGHFSEDQGDIAALFDMSNYNDPASFPTQLSYRLKLHGPSMHVQTACSTSLSAVHLACKSLLAGECEMAIAGGACITDPTEGGYLYQEGMILSPDGHCRTFDAEGNGTVNGNGVGVVLLKLLEDAVEDGDPIHAVIVESVMNNDGERKVAFEAPSVKGQSEAISQVYDIAEIPFDSLGMIEAHGTATKLGDPIEVQALNRVASSLLDESALKDFKCALGSVKSNMGHLDAAAGIAGLIKATLSVRFAKIPASLHFDQANPHLELDSTPFYIPKHTQVWPSSLPYRRAGISSFGIGGTNVHVLVEQAPDTIESSNAQSDTQMLVMPMSAGSPQALKQQIAGYLRYLDIENDTLSLSQLSKQMQSESTLPGSRAAFAITDAKDWGQQLQAWNILDNSRHMDGEFVWLFAGQGSHKVAMGQGLAANFPAFKEHYHGLLKVAAQQLDMPLAQLLAKAEDDMPLNTLYAQPLIYALQTALAIWLRELGCRVDAIIGFSLGEWAAAALAGVFSPEQGMKLVVERARLMEETPQGALFTLSKKQAENIELPTYVWRVCELNPRTWTIACAISDLEQTIEWLKQQKLAFKRVDVSHAFHTPLVQQAAERLKSMMVEMPLKRAAIPIYSTVLGRVLTEGEMSEPDYWAQQMLRPIAWREASMQASAAMPQASFVQVGPSADMLQHLRKWTDATARHTFTTIGSATAQSEHKAILSTLCEFWMRGCELDWSKACVGEQTLEPSSKQRLPSYVFKKQHFASILPAAKNRSLYDSRFYTQRWESCQPEVTAQKQNLRERQVYILAHKEDAFEKQLNHFYQTQGAIVSSIVLDFDEFKPEQAYVHLGMLLAQKGLQPAQEIDFVLTGLRHSLSDSAVAIWSYWLPTFLARWSADNSDIKHIRQLNISSNMLAIDENGLVEPQKSQLLGPVLILPEEYDAFHTLALDVSSELPADPLCNALRPWIEQQWNGAQLFHYSKEQYWHKRLSGRLPTLDDDNAIPKLSRQSRVMITGANGGMGRAIAEHLARVYRCHLFLVMRQAVPKRAVWQSEIDLDDSARELIDWAREMESYGANIEFIQADLGDSSALDKAFEPVFTLCEQGDGFDYIFHTAGRGEGSLLQLRDESESIATLAPKVTGTAFLVEHIHRLGSPNVLLFSSLGNLLPKEKVGQIAYVSANASIEAYAQYLRNNHISALAIAWDDWSESGMATRSAMELDNAITQNAEMQTANNEVVWTKLVSAATSWYLDEHRLNGDTTVMPAMAYMALIHEAYRDSSDDAEQHLTVSEMVIESPMLVEQSEQRQVTVLLNLAAEEVCVYSGHGTFSRETWQKHAHAKLQLDAQQLPKRVELAALLESSTRVFETEQAMCPKGALIFGPRWHNIVAVDKISEGELCIELKLADDFAGEAEALGLHVALLDTATLIDAPTREDTQYAPLSIGKLEYYTPMRQHVLSHVSVKPLPNGKLLQVNIYAIDGTPLVSIHDLMLVAADALLKEEHKVIRLGPPQTQGSHFNFIAHSEPRRAPGENDVEIEVKAAGLNFKDVLIALGVIPSPEDKSMTFGQEASGVITRLGSGVTHFKVGDRVMAAGHSCFAEHVLMPASVVAKIPPTIGYTQAATIPVAFTTAWIALVKTANLKRGERILIHSAASGVGMAAMQIAQYLGAEVWATAGTEEKHQLLLRMGAKGVATSRSREFGQYFRAELGERPFDVVLNALAGELLEESLDLLACQGRFVELGLRDILDNKQLGLKMFAAGGSFHAVQAGAEHPEYAASWKEVVENFEQEQFHGLPTKAFPLDELGIAFEEMAQGKHIGKFAVTLPQTEQNKGFVAKLRKEGLSDKEGVEIAMAMAAAVKQSSLHYLAISKLPAGVVLEKQNETQQMVLGRKEASISEAVGESENWQSKTADELLPLMQAMLSDFLDLKNVDPDTSFFELGATSLDLIQFAKLLEQRMGREIAVAMLFKATSLRALSQALVPPQGATTVTQDVDLSSKRKGLKARQKLRKSSHKRSLTDG